MSEIPTGWRRWLWPLRSRKVQVAIVTLIVSWAADQGWVLDPAMVDKILLAGLAIIGGIAIEDAGAKAGARR